MTTVQLHAIGDTVGVEIGGHVTFRKIAPNTFSFNISCPKHKRLNTAQGVIVLATKDTDVVYDDQSCLGCAGATYTPGCVFNKLIQNPTQYDMFGQPKLYCHVINERLFIFATNRRATHCLSAALPPTPIAPVIALPYHSCIVHIKKDENGIQIIK